ELPLCGDPLALGDRLGGFLIQGRGDLGGATLVGDRPHDDRPAHLADPHLDDVIRVDVLGRLHPLAVQAYPAAEPGLGCQPARLAEPRGPQPLVNPDGVHYRPSAESNEPRTPGRRRMRSRGWLEGSPPSPPLAPPPRSTRPASRQSARASAGSVLCR